MIRPFLPTPLLSGLIFALALSQADPAIASQSDINLLQSYVGDWEGRGVMTTSGEQESVKCKLAVTSSSPTRVQFNGQCAIAGGAVSLKGTLGYIEEHNRFEATGSSNVIKKIVAVGRRSGSAIDFTMRQMDAETNSWIDLVVGLSLRNDVINVNAEITYTNSGVTSVAKVPLQKNT